MIRTRMLPVTLAVITGVGCLFISDRASSPNSGSLITEANAIIGRPLTPLSYAGVARRTTRRAIYGSAAVGAAAVGAAAIAPRCVQVAGAYGRIIARCY